MQASTSDTAPGFAAAHERLLHDPRFQFDFFEFIPPKPPAWLEWIGKILKPLAPLMPYLFWATLAGGAGFLLFLIGRELIRSPGASRRALVLAPESLAPSPRRIRALLAEADRLASQGLFGEAAHVLLFRTLDDIDEKRPGLIAPALTAREILSLQALPTAARQPLASIAVVVERFVFGGQAVDARTFGDCRAAYEHFVQAVAAV